MGGAAGGREAARSGDVNGDGFADLIATGGDSLTYEVFAGGGAFGTTRVANQRHPDDNRPIALGGLSADDGAFGIELTTMKPGYRDLEEMKHLAHRRWGLNTYINQRVRRRYARKLR